MTAYNVTLLIKPSYFEQDDIHIPDSTPLITCCVLHVTFNTSTADDRSDKEVNEAR